MGTDQRGRIVGGILISSRSARDRTSNRRCEVTEGCGRVEAASTCPGLSTHDSAGYIWNECCECPNRRLYRAQASGNSRMQPGNSRIQAAQKERFDEGIRPAIWNCWADSFVNAGSRGISRPRKKITSGPTCAPVCSKTVSPRNITPRVTCSPSNQIAEDSHREYCRGQSARNPRAVTGSRGL